MFISNRFLWKLVIKEKIVWKIFKPRSAQTRQTQTSDGWRGVKTLHGIGVVAISEGRERFWLFQRSLLSTFHDSGPCVLRHPRIRDVWTWISNLPAWEANSKIYSCMALLYTFQWNTDTRFNTCTPCGNFINIWLKKDSTSKFLLFKVNG